MTDTKSDTPEAFDYWWETYHFVPDTPSNKTTARDAWLASREATAKRCVEICREEAGSRFMRQDNPLPGDEGLIQGHKGVTANKLAEAIEREFLGDK